MTVRKWPRAHNGVNTPFPTPDVLGGASVLASRLVSSLAPPNSQFCLAIAESLQARVDEEERFSSGAVALMRLRAGGAVLQSAALARKRNLPESQTLKPTVACRFLEFLRLRRSFRPNASRLAADFRLSRRVKIQSAGDSAFCLLSALILLAAASHCAATESRGTLSNP